jgi:phosphoribosylamine---glycine ligase
MAKVLLIGTGGREHALAWALSRSPHVEQIYVATGNAGTSWAAGDGQGFNPSAPSENIAISDYAELLAFVQANAIDLTVVGPEVPLVAGIVDDFQAAGLAIFGPVKAAAQLEGSKAFSKDIMTEQGIPTGEFFTTDDYEEAREFLEEYQKPVVVKADGLAAGKGVIVCDTREEASQALQQIMIDRAFGDAGEVVVIEERLNGREISVLAFCDGKIAKPMLMARDYKRALDGNIGLNTGGMGAIAPADDIPPNFILELQKNVLQPVLDAMNALGTPFVGILFAGVMLTEDSAKVLEYNCRFGDPETQVVLPLLKTDLYEIMQACIAGKLDEIDLEWEEAYCATVVCAAGSYPEDYAKGLPITGLESVQDGIVFHAGTKCEGDVILTNGGRVLNVTAKGKTLDEALAAAYRNVEKIHFEKMHYRKDIGVIYE